MREIAGSGSVLGHPSTARGARGIEYLAPQRIADATVPVVPALDARLHALLSEIATETSPETRVRVANETIRACVA